MEKGYLQRDEMEESFCSFVFLLGREMSISVAKMTEDSKEVVQMMKHKWPEWRLNQECSKRNFPEA